MHSYKATHARGVELRMQEWTSNGHGNRLVKSEPNQSHKTDNNKSRFLCI